MYILFKSYLIYWFSIGSGLLPGGKMFNIIGVRWGGMGGFPLSAQHQKGGRCANIPNITHNKGKDKRQQATQQEERGQEARGRGAKVEKVAKKNFFFTNRLKKKSIFDWGVVCVQHIVTLNPYISEPLKIFLLYLQKINRYGKRIWIL